MQQRNVTPQGVIPQGSRYVNELDRSHMHAAVLLASKFISNDIKSTTYSILLYQVQIANYWFWFWAGDAMNLEVLKGLVHKTNAWEKQEYEYDVNHPKSSYTTLYFTGVCIQRNTA